MNRIGLKLTCFVISIVIWVQVASTSTVEQTTSLPLRLTGVSEGLTAAGSALPAEIKVRVQGSKLALLSHHYFNHYIGEVRVDVSHRAVGPTFSYEVSQNDVFTDFVVVGVQPPVRLRLKLDQKVQRMLPVRMVTSGELPTEVGYLKDVELAPDSVLVSGPARFFLPDSAVLTEVVELGRLHSSSEVPLVLQSPHEHLKLGLSEGHADFQVAPILERTFANIQVIPLVDAGQLEVGVSPPMVDVMVRGVADSIQALKGDRLMITVSVGHLKQGVHLVSGEASLPPWLTLIGLAPAEFQVVVGHFGTTEADSAEQGAVTVSE